MSELRKWLEEMLPTFFSPKRELPDHPLSAEELAHFKLRLQETMIWCNRRIKQYGINPKNTLRSPELAPPKIDSLTADVVMESSWMKSVITARSKLLGSTDASSFSTVRDLQGGKLLVYYVGDHATMMDESEQSEGYFDDDLYPPWDTWVEVIPYKEPLLIGYVPPQFERFAEMGIFMNGSAQRWVNGLHWLKNDKKLPFLKQFSQEGWL